MKLCNKAIFLIFLTQVYDIEAPCVVSNAGLKNTFQKLLPKNVAEKSYFDRLSKDLRPSWGTFQAFIGLNASKEELGLKPQGPDSTENMFW